jgi:hypothetical protein
MDSVPALSASKETLLHMSDSPANIGVAGSPNVVAAPSQSMFQSDLMALKIRLAASWALRDPRGLAWLTTTAW